tara:strand:- start:9 stop:719 length:711 start_codon:yes stop_codon:yes gene_type:complete
MLKNFIKLFIPPIFYPGVLREIRNKIFFKKKTKKFFDYEKNFYKRHAFINKAISNYKDCKYLEIGVQNNDVFNSIPLKIENKFGVDPVSGGNFKMTSDDFFKKFPDLKFDVIFIDGLHEYKQCQKDCVNAMKQLNTNGVILFHDLLPRSYFEEHVPRKQSSWTGNIWRVAVELSNSKNVDFKIINIDMGLGILKLKEGFSYKIMDELKNKTFYDFLEYKKNFPIIDAEEGLELLSN